MHGWPSTWSSCGIFFCLSLWNIVEKGKDLSYNEDICPRLLGQSEWVGGDVELSDQFNNKIII